MIKSKKSFEMQFNWIFVLFIGASILIFFTAIIYKQRGLSEESVDSNSLVAIQSIISSESVALDSSKLETFPKAEMEISCNRIAVGKASKQYPNLVLFAPSELNGNKIIWQTMPFNIPFRALNLVYLTGNDVRYIFVGGDTVINELSDSMSQYANKESVSNLNSIKNENNQKVRFVFKKTSPSSLNANILSKFAGMKNGDVTAIEIDGDENKGIIKFFEKGSSNWVQKGYQSYYLTNPMLLGAVYSDKAENYECNVKNALIRTMLVTDVYAKKANSLKNTIPTCNDDYNSFENVLTSLKNDKINPTITNLEKMKDITTDEIKSKNQNLKSKSCPLIY